MKKVSLLLAALMLAAAILCSCSGGSKKPLTQVFDDIKSKVELKDFNEYTSEKSLERFYGITSDEFDEYAGGINSTGVNQEEIVMFKAKDSSNAAKIKASLDKRYESKMAQNKNYNKEQAAVIEKCKVEQYDLYVTMFVSPEAEKITQIFKEDLGL
ncbi:MAG: DUF4358 domain-containing protein [Ruminococcus sp.]|nr:DUF4358 domain-containing protein [Ruminococcus sp.]